MKIPEIILPNIAFVAIRAYAAYSYLYYEHDISLVYDHEFDTLCEWLLRHYAELKYHDTNGYLDESALKAGTGYHLTGKVVGLTRKWACEQANIPEPTLRPEKQPIAKRKRVAQNNDFAFLD